MRRTVVVTDDAQLEVVDVTGIAAARALVRSAAAGLLPVDRLDDATLVVSELVTNALEHGSGRPVSVEVRASTTGVDVIVAGPASSIPDIDPRLAPVDALRGRGLFIVATLSDEVRVGRDRGRVEITSRFARANAPTSS